MAMQSQPSRIPEPFAGSGSKNTIPATNTTPSASQAASWASGFPPECSQPISAGGCPVPRNDMNGALNWLSKDFAFRQDGGIWEWSALADYDSGRFVRGSNGVFYKSAAQSGPNTAAGAVDPTTDSGAYWVQIPTMADIAALNYATQSWVGSQGYALDSAVVHINGSETISGQKTFDATPIVRSTLNATISEINTDLSRGTIPAALTEGPMLASYDKDWKHLFSLHKTIQTTGESSLGILVSDMSNAGVDDFTYFTVANTGSFKGIYSNINFHNINSILVLTRISGGDSYHALYAGDNNFDGASLQLYGRSSTQASPGSFYLRASTKSSSDSAGSDCTFQGQADGTLLWGGQPVQISSDERLKSPLKDVDDEILDAWGEVSWGEFKFLDAIKRKGDEARAHVGLIAQAVDAVFTANGLDICKYGILCHEQREEVKEQLDEKGKVVRQAEPAVDLWMVRYTEALCMEAAYQRRRADRAEARLAALEERLTAIEAKLLNS